MSRLAYKANCYEFMDGQTDPECGSTFNIYKLNTQKCNGKRKLKKYIQSAYISEFEEKLDVITWLY